MRSWRNLLIILIVAVFVGTFLMIVTSGKSKEGVPFDLDPPILVSVNEHVSNEVSGDYPEMDAHIEKFLKRWEIKGASLAIINDGMLSYAKGYGIADDTVKMQPSHIMRIASFSKLITAVAIMKMEEDSILSITDKVFGEDGILPQFTEFSSSKYKDITVENLLRHQGGFTTHRGDPMFMVREISIWDKLNTVPTSDQIIDYCLRQRIGFAPGTSTSYSNVGYLILSRVIEELSGMSYEAFCQEKILKPIGCLDMHIAANTYEEKFPNEVRYYEANGAILVPSFDNSGKMKKHSYGGNNVTGLQGGGAWVCSPSEYARLVASIDGDPVIKDILSPNSISKMMGMEKNVLPMGWTRGTLDGEWLRTGTLSGTSAVTKRHEDGSIWVFITNTSSWRGAQFTGNIRGLIKECKELEGLPSQDLFTPIT